MSDTTTNPPVWDGERRITGTEDFHNDNDPSAYAGPDVPVYEESYQMFTNGRGFTAYSVTLQPGIPIRILGEDPARSAVFINGIAEQSILIGDQSSLQVGIGYIVAGGEKLQTTDEIWAIPVGVASILCSYWVERDA